MQWKRADRAKPIRPFKRTPWIRLCRSTGVAPLGGSGVSRFGGYFFSGSSFLPLFSGMNGLHGWAFTGPGVFHTTLN